MSIEAILGIVLFILPGYLTYKWIKILSVSEDDSRKKSLEKTTEILLFSVAACALWLPVIRIFTIDIPLDFSRSDVQRVSDLFPFLAFLLLYSAINVIASITVAFLWVKFVRGSILNVINRYRGGNKLPHIDVGSVWGSSLDLGNDRVAQVYKLNEDPEKGEWGIISSGSVSAENLREVLLVGDREIIPFEQLTHEHTYIDVRSHTVMKVFKYTPSE